jgi:hypothetical protein
VQHDAGLLFLSPDFVSPDVMPFRLEADRGAGWTDR